MAYASPANTAGTAANRYACSTKGPMPGTLRWIMKGMTLTPAPTIEAMPVAVRPRRPMPRTSPERAGMGTAADYFFFERSARRMILPVAVNGSDSTNSTMRGYSWAASLVRTCSCNSAASTGEAA